MNRYLNLAVPEIRCVDGNHVIKKRREGDWRKGYFVPENLISSVEHAEALKPVVPADMTMPEMALRFILSNPNVNTVIPGMRKSRYVESNVAASDAGPLPEGLVLQLRAHRWEREPTEWSQ